ncbi:E3 ubiquitin-protein ligase PDZRN3, partial [Aptenodytes forsteri]
MGFELDRFNGDVDPDFKCNLCNKVLEDPLTTPCGHVFCAGCVPPWVVQQGSCPVNCQRISTKELNHVLPLKSLILKLDIKCDNHARGCEAVVPLQHLGEHAETCDFSPANWPRRLCSFSAVLQKAVTQFSEAASNLKKAGRCHVTTDLRSSGQSITCLSQHFGQLSNTNSFRVSAYSKHAVPLLSLVNYDLYSYFICFVIRCNCSRYVKTEVGLALTNWVHRLDVVIAKLTAGCSGSSVETKALTLVLHRDSGSLGFNIIGGRPCVDNQDGSSSEGIYVSKIVDTGPAAKEGGLQIHDRIIEV